MKSSLERTAILSQDLDDQPSNERYVVLIPELNLVLAADAVRATADVVSVYTADGTLLCCFAAALTWLCIIRTRIDLVTREQQLRRINANQFAEIALAKELAPTPTSNEIGAGIPGGAIGTSGTGMYL